MVVSADILTELEGLRDLFRADAAGYVAEVTQGWQDLASSLARAEQAPRSQAEALLAKVHRLAGTAATFGLGELGQAATALEDHLTALIEAPGESRSCAVSGYLLLARVEAAIAPSPAGPS